MQGTAHDHICGRPDFRSVLQSLVQTSHAAIAVLLSTHYCCSTVISLSTRTMEVLSPLLPGSLCLVLVTTYTALSVTAVQGKKRSLQ